MTDRRRTPDNQIAPDAARALADARVVLTGHFQLSSGLHSSQYVEKFNLLQSPRSLALLARTLADEARELGATVIVGPTTGGIILAYEVARQASLQVAIAERAEDGSGRVIRNDRALPQHATAFVVDDVLTSGSTLFDTLDAVRRCGATPVGVGVLVDRSPTDVDFQPLSVCAVVRFDIPAYPPALCPLCIDGSPITLT